jgi:hypothetical protein
MQHYRLLIADKFPDTAVEAGGAAKAFSSRSLPHAVVLIRTTTAMLQAPAKGRTLLGGAVGAHDDPPDN